MENRYGYDEDMLFTCMKLSKTKEKILKDERFLTLRTQNLM